LLFVVEVPPKGSFEELHSS